MMVISDVDFSKTKDGEGSLISIRALPIFSHAFEGGGGVWGKQ